MRRGRNFLLLSGALVVAGCATSHHVQVRAIPNPGATSKAGDDLLAQARGQLALGDVGLALESFRTLQREQPENPEVFEGIAQCYAAMSRYDLVRTNLEFALAYSPSDPRLLSELASSLDQLGETERAAEVRAEVARLVRASEVRPQTAAAEVTPIGLARTGSETVKLPAPALISHPVVLKAVTPTAVPHFDQARLDAPLPHIAVAIRQVEIANAPSSLGDHRAAVDPGLSAVEVAAEPVPAAHSTADGADAALPRLSVPRSRVEVATAPRSVGIRNAFSDMKLPMIALVAEPAPAVARKYSAPPAEFTVAAFKSSPSTPVRIAAAPSSMTADRALADMMLSKVELAPPETAPVNMRARAVEAAVASQAQANIAEPPKDGRPIERERIEAPRREGAYLSRTSPREVALITTPPRMHMASIDSDIAHLPAVSSDEPVKPGPEEQPRPQQLAVVARPVRWIPLNDASMPQNVELLNAARSQGLAARTRIALQDRGWRKVRIGNAIRARQSSLVLYSAERTQVAHRLASQFRCASVRVDGLRNVVVLLGRDSAGKRNQSTRA